MSTAVEADLTTLAFRRELSFGAQASGAYKRIRFTGESLSHGKTAEPSNEIRPDRGVADLPLLSVAASGAVNFELTIADWLIFLLAAIGKTAWNGQSSSPAEVAVNATLQRLENTGAGDNFELIPNGGFVQISGFADSRYNGIKRVIRQSTDYLDFAPGSFPADVASAIGITVFTKDARAGTAPAKPSFTIERRLDKITTTTHSRYEYQSYLGQMVNTLNLNVESAAMITGSVEFMGQKGQPTYSTVAGIGFFALGTLTCGGTDPTDANTITIGSRVYTLKTSIGSLANAIKIDGTPAAQATNIRNALRADKATYGVTHNVKTIDPLVDVLNLGMADATVEVRARYIGTGANSVATTTTAVSGAIAWGAATLAGGAEPVAYNEPSTDPVVTGGANVGSLMYAGDYAQEEFRIINLTINNNLAPRDKISQVGAFDMRLGKLAISGKLSAYFQDNTMYRQYIDHAESSVAYVITDANGQSLAITLPRVNFSTGDPQAKGISTDVMFEPDFTALVHPTIGSSIIFNHFPAH